MARYKAHVVGGLCVYMLIIMGLGLRHTAAPLQLAEWMLCSVVGSLFPDIDIKSKGQRLIYSFLGMLLILLLLAQRYVTAAWIGTGAIFPLITKHRGVWHELWFLGIATACGTYQLTRIFPHATTRIMLNATFFGFGFVSHLLLDGYWRRLVR